MAKILGSRDNGKQNLPKESANAVIKPLTLKQTNGELSDSETEMIKPLSAVEQETKDTVHSHLLEVVDLALINTLPQEQARIQIREICMTKLHTDSAPLATDQRKRVVEAIEDEVLGLGPLEPLLKDKTVSDILINGYQNVYVERRGKLELANVRFKNDRHLMGIIDRIVSQVSRRVDESSPMVDARLADGSRVNAIIPPLAIDGPTMSIRRFAVELLSMDSLIDLGTVTPAIAEVLMAVVKSRLNVLISGGTGAGKTTMLNIMSGFIPSDERIVTIEDSAELQLQQPHVCLLYTSPSPRD